MVDKTLSPDDWSWHLANIKEFERMNDKLMNLENMILDIEKRFIEYAEQNPKTDDQWTEERLRALEDKIYQIYRIIAIHLFGDKVDIEDLPSLMGSVFKKKESKDG